MSMLLTPKISEKAIGMAEHGTYVFQVPKNANKTEVARAVEQQFNVKVVDVNILVQKGKEVFWRQRGKRIAGRRSDVKKAMVKLKKGQKIALFEEGSK